MAEWIYTIELVLESTHHMVSNNRLYIIWRLVFIEIQVYQYSDIISYLSKLAWHQLLLAKVWCHKDKLSISSLLINLLSFLLMDYFDLIQLTV